MAKKKLKLRGYPNGGEYKQSDISRYQDTLTNVLKYYPEGYDELLNKVKSDTAIHYNPYEFTSYITQIHPNSPYNPNNKPKYVFPKSKIQTPKELNFIPFKSRELELENDIKLHPEKYKQEEYKNGGKVNTLEGDLYSKVILNRNRGKEFVDRAYAMGQYHNQFGTQVEDFNEYATHKMGWGEDESGQAYMFPTIFNPNNDAVKVPNQYADYISSQGYKNETGLGKHKLGGKLKQYGNGGVEQFLPKFVNDNTRVEKPKVGNYSGFGTKNNPIQFPEVDITAKPTYPNRLHNKDIGNASDLASTMFMTDLPRQGVTRGLDKLINNTPYEKYDIDNQNVANLLGIKNPIGKFAMNAITDPTSYLPLPYLNELGKNIKGAFTKPIKANPTLLERTITDNPKRNWKIPNWVDEHGKESRPDFKPFQFDNKDWYKNTTNANIDENIADLPNLKSVNFPEYEDKLKTVLSAQDKVNEWVNSNEWVNRRMSTAGETLEQAKKAQKLTKSNLNKMGTDRVQILQPKEGGNYNVRGFYTNGTDDIGFSNPSILLLNDKPNNLFNSANHEFLHAANTATSDGYFMKGIKPIELEDFSKVNPAHYRYMNKLPEQQVRGVRALDWLKDNNYWKHGEPITEDHIDILKRNSYLSSQNPIPQDVGNLISSYKNKKEITDFLNKVYTTIPIAVGAGIASQNKKKNGGNISQRGQWEILQFKHNTMKKIRNKETGEVRMVEDHELEQYGLGGSIHIKKSHKGLLHKNLGIKQGEKIPASKLKIKESDSEAVRKRKQFAINAKKFHKAEDGLNVGDTDNWMQWRSPIDQGITNPYYQSVNPRQENFTMNPMGIDPNTGLITERAQSLNPPSNEITLNGSITKPQFKQKNKYQANTQGGRSFMNTLTAGLENAPEAIEAAMKGDFSKLASADVSPYVIAGSIAETIGNRKVNKRVNKQFADNFKEAQTQQYLNHYSDDLYGTDFKMMEDGGINKLKSFNGNVEVEKDEHVLLPNGFSDEVTGKKHSEGGEVMQLPENTRIFSEKLKHPDYGKSYAKIAKKFETKKDFEKMDDKVHTDKISNTTAELNITLKNRALDNLFEEMQDNKRNGIHGSKVAKEIEKEDQMKNGGFIKAGNGKSLRGTGKDVENNFKDLDEVYANYVANGYRGKKDITEMREWSYQKNPQEVSAYIERTKPTNKHLQIWKDKYSKTEPIDISKMSPEDRFAGYNDNLWDFRAHKFISQKPKFVAKAKEPKTGTAVSPSPRLGEINSETGYRPDFKGVATPYFFDNYQLAPIPRYKFNPNLIEYRPQHADFTEIERQYQGAKTGDPRLDASLFTKGLNAKNQQLNQVRGLNQQGKMQTDQYNAGALDRTQTQQYGENAQFRDLWLRELGNLGTQKLIDRQDAASDFSKKMGYYNETIPFLKESFNPTSGSSLDYTGNTFDYGTSDKEELQKQLSKLKAYETLYGTKKYGGKIKLNIKKGKKK